MTTTRLLPLVLFLSAVPLHAQAFLPDNFATTAPPDGPVLDLAPQNDGRVVVVGDFSKVGTIARSRIARYTATGAFDPGFFPGSGANGPIHAVAIAPDNSIYIGGEFTTYNDNPANRIARLTSTGRLDPSFTWSYSDTVRDLAMANGILYVGGDFTGGLEKIGIISGIRSGIAGGGTNGPVHAIAVEENAVGGALITIGGNFTRAGGVTVGHLAFLDRDLRVRVDAALLGGANAPVHALAVDEAERGDPPRRSHLIAGGEFTVLNGQARNGLAVVYGDDSIWAGDRRGELATNLGTEPISGTIYSLAFNQRSRMVAIGGDFTFATRPTWRNLLIASSVTGGFPSTAWNEHQPNQPVRALLYQPDDMLVIGGEFTTLDGASRSHLGRLYGPSGSSVPNTPTFTSWSGLDTDKIHLAWELDQSFTGVLGYKLERRPPGGSWSPVPLSDPQATEFLLGSLAPSTPFFFRISAFNGNGFSPPSPFVIAASLPGPVYGLPDPAFSPAEAPAGEAIAIDAHQRLIVGGFNQIKRLLPDGSADPSFSAAIEGGACRKLVVQPDGRIVIAGFFTSVHGEAQPYLARLLPDGALDSSFSPDFDNGVLDLEILPDDRLLVSGFFHTVAGQAQATVAILHPDGRLDPSFRPTISGINLAPVITARLASDRNIVAGGSITSVNGTASPVLVKLSQDGNLVNSFSIDADLNLFDIDAFDLLPDGKILLFAVASPIPRPAGFNSTRLLRLNANGSLDTTFGPAQFGFPLPDPIRLTIMPQPDGAVVVSGSFHRIGEQSRFGLARIRSVGSLDANFTGGCGLQIKRSNLSPEFFAVGAEELASLPDGRIVAVGSFKLANQREVRNVAVLTNLPTSIAASPPATLEVIPDQSGRLLLRWPAPADQTGYTIERSPDGVTEWTEIARVPGSWRRFVDPDAPLGETVHYRLRGISGDQVSTATSVVASGIAVSPFALWLASFGLDPALDPDLDLEGDQWSLYLEFALDRHPTEPETDRWFTSSSLNPLTIEITTPRANLRYELEQSIDAETWTPRVDQVGGGASTLAETFDPNTDPASLLLRLRVTPVP